VVFSVGNDNRDFTRADIGAGARQWAAYNRTIAVASSSISPPDPSQIKTSTSNFGSALDVCAPGGGPAGGTEARTLSTTNASEGDTAGSASASSKDYDDFGQTSCACPQVAGTVALMLSVYPDLTWHQVRQILRDTADQIDASNADPIGRWVDTDGDGVADFSQWYGYGRLNSSKAVTMAQRQRFFAWLSAVLALIHYATFAFVIVVGGLMITPGGIQCTVCGPIINNLLGMVSISLGVLGFATSILERTQYRGIESRLASR
jgi:subtilisin family serine protease